MILRTRVCTYGSWRFFFITLRGFYTEIGISSILFTTSMHFVGSTARSMRDEYLRLSSDMVPLLKKFAGDWDILHFTYDIDAFVGSIAH